MLFKFFDKIIDLIVLLEKKSDKIREVDIITILQFVFSGMKFYKILV